MCSVSPWRVGQTCSTGFTTPREIWGWPVSCFKNISLFQIMMIHLCACRRLFHLHGHPWIVLRHEPYPWCPLWRVFQGEYPHHHHHQCCNLNMFAVRYFPTSPPPGEREIAVSWRFPKDARKTTNGRGLARISGLSNLNMDNRKS